MNTIIPIIENEYARLWYYPVAGIVHHKFLQPASDDAFRKVLTSGLKLLKEHGAQKWLSDDRENSILSAESSAWSQDYWLPLAVKAGWKYWAMLPTANPRGQVNLKRLMKYVNETYGIRVEVFSDPDAAWQWLAQQGSEAESE